ncbi:V0D/AC39 family V-type ATPase subunit [Treponema zioleckii]|uniref:V0D/AC39 family V-type ATPase subunit n=1 Tax=Treponema zioleckii TaxID=331680 RepID=UPI00168B5A87|nr:V-type ATPase subunit [Treponema zioleckii]
MDSSAASSYVYAKASGLLSKSFVGPRLVKLFSVKSLRELYTLLFDDEIPAVPESMLAKQIEIKAENRFIDQYINLIRNFSKPAHILVSLLHFYDYDNLKDIAASLSLGKNEKPQLIDIKEYSMLNYGFWPNILKITENSKISWYNKVPEITEQQIFDSRLDSEYISELWESVKKLPKSERELVSELIGFEISVQNILWVMRLRVYYKMEAEEITEKLAYANKDDGKKDIFAGEALSILEKDTGLWDAWKDWKYSEFLNPHEEASVWELDPCWVEKAFNRKIAKLAYKSFHKNPMSVLSLVSWFKIKQNELNCIRTVAEGLRLDVESNELMNVAGVNASVF